MPILDWDVHDVGQWLDSIGMVEYKENFMSNDIRGRELLNLNRQDLKVRQHYRIRNITKCNNVFSFMSVSSNLSYIKLKDKTTETLVVGMKRASDLHDILCPFTD